MIWPSAVRAATTGAHENVGLWNAQLLEKYAVHLPVVVLAGMDDRVLKVAAFPDARTIGAIFIKLGLAPTTRQISGMSQSLFNGVAYYFVTPTTGHEY